MWNKTFVVFLISIFTQFAYADWTIDGNTYTMRKKIAISNANVDGTLVDFPLLVKISSDTSIGAVAQSDGDDLRFTTTDGATLLYSEKENFSVTAGAASGNIWVKVPFISSSQSTNIYVYYGDADAEVQTGATSVWDTNFKVVHHMTDVTTSTTTDSTSNANNGAKKGTNEPIEADGTINKGQDFDGTDDYITKTSPAGLPTAVPLTVSFLVKPDAIGATPATSNRVTSHGERSLVTDRGWGIGFDNTDEILFTTFSVKDYQGTTFSVSIGEWHYVATIIDTAYDTTIYHYNVTTDVVVTQFITYTIGINNPSIDVFYIGCIDSGTAGERIQFFDGIIDEVRISNVQRSNAWIKFEAYNIGSATNELTFGSEETSVAVTTSLIIVD